MLAYIILFLFYINKVLMKFRRKKRGQTFAWERWSLSCK